MNWGSFIECAVFQFMFSWMMTVCDAMQTTIGFKCFLIKDETWDCVCPQRNVVLTLGNNGGFFIVCDVNYKFHFMRTFGFGMIPGFGKRRKRNSEENENDALTNDSSYVFELNCTMNDHFSWDCHCPEKNVVLLMHDSKDFFIVCDSNYDVVLMKSAAFGKVQNTVEMSQQEHEDERSKKIGSLEHSKDSPLIESEKEGALKEGNDLEDFEKEIEEVEKESSRKENDEGIKEKVQEPSENTSKTPMTSSPDNQTEEPEVNAKVTHKEDLVYNITKQIDKTTTASPTTEEKTHKETPSATTEQPSTTEYRYHEPTVKSPTTTVKPTTTTKPPPTTAKPPTTEYRYHEPTKKPPTTEYRYHEPTTKPPTTTEEPPTTEYRYHEPTKKPPTTEYRHHEPTKERTTTAGFYDHIAALLAKNSTTNDTEISANETVAVKTTTIKPTTTRKKKDKCFILGRWLNEGETYGNKYTCFYTCMKHGALKRHCNVIHVGG